MLRINKNNYFKFPPERKRAINFFKLHLLVRKTLSDLFSATNQKGSLLEKRVLDSVKFLPEQKHKGVTTLLKKGHDLSIQDKIEIVESQLPELGRFYLAITNIAEFSSSDDLQKFCGPKGILRKFRLPEESIYFALLLKDLNEKTKGKASGVYYDDEEKIAIQATFEKLFLNLRSEDEFLETLAPLPFEGRLILAMREASKTAPDQVYSFCKKGGKLRNYKLPDHDPGLHQILNFLDKKSNGLASKSYYQLR